jgi:hypothetical protein
MPPSFILLPLPCRQLWLDLLLLRSPSVLRLYRQNHCCRSSSRAATALLPHQQPGCLRNNSGRQTPTQRQLLTFISD